MGGDAVQVETGEVGGRSLPGREQLAAAMSGQAEWIHASPYPMRGTTKCPRSTTGPFATASS